MTRNDPGDRFCQLLCSHLSPWNAGTRVFWLLRCPRPRPRPRPRPDPDPDPDPDPALDLICAWNLLAAGPRLALRDALRCTDLDWERGRAWAFQQAMGLVWYYAETNPVMSRLGRVTLDRIQSDGRPA